MDVKVQRISALKTKQPNIHLNKNKQKTLQKTTTTPNTPLPPKKPQTTQTTAEKTNETKQKAKTPLSFKRWGQLPVDVTAVCHWRCKFCVFR